MDMMDMVVEITHENLDLTKPLNRYKIFYVML